VLRSEDDSEVCEKLTWEVRNDVHDPGLTVWNDINRRNADTKCEFTPSTATLVFRADVSRQENRARPLTFTEIAPMFRRPLVLLAVVVASMVASACADVTAPHGDTPCSGYIDMVGRCVV
jgi:hypothetical protein